MSKQSSLKNSKPFLQKFDGKKNIISKEGLLHLLEMKRHTLEQKHKNKKQQYQPQGLFALKNLVPVNLKANRLQQNYSNILKSKESRVKKSSPTPYSSHESKKAQSEALSELKSMEIPSKLKLPSIYKSSSHSKYLQKKQANQTEVDVGGNYIHSKTVPKKNTENIFLNNLSKKIELDTYAIQHLEQLNKFQQQIIEERQREAQRSFPSNQEH